MPLPFDIIPLVPYSYQNLGRNIEFYYQHGQHTGVYPGRVVRVKGFQLPLWIFEKNISIVCFRKYTVEYLILLIKSRIFCCKR